MTFHLLDLRPVKDFTPQDKETLPVSIALDHDGSPVVVSRYGDVRWDFYPYIPQENKRASSKLINWRIKLPDGSRLTDPEHAALLESTKDFIWSLFADPVEGRKRPTMLTLIIKVADTKPLLHWMVSQGLKCFADLAGRTLDYIAFARLNLNGKPATAKNIELRLLIVESLYHQRNKLNDALHTYPWPHESANTLAGVKNGELMKPKTEVIPDAVAERLCMTALDYVRHRSQRIFDILKATVKVAEDMADAGHGSKSISEAKTAVIRKMDYKGQRHLHAETIRLRTACYIIIDLFSGIRDSELMSIAENCISHGKSKDNSTNVLRLHGIIYKTGIRPKCWLVPPLVEEAVDVLIRLTVPLRDKMNAEEDKIKELLPLTITKERSRLIKRLTTVKQHKNKLFLSPGKNGGEIAVLSGAGMRRDLRNFCTELGILGKDGQPYPLHSHQFRRTYAHFVARSELGDLITLRDHFCHWSVDMTAFYADGGADKYEADTELLEMVAKEKMERQFEIMGKHLDSNEPLANGEHWLKGWRNLVRTAANKEELIKEFAGTLTLHGTGHSWCVGNAKGSCCGGLCVFEAQMCVECNHGIIGQEHRPVWEGIRNQQKEALELDDMGLGGRARAQEILAQAEKVLKRLEGLEAA